MPYQWTKLHAEHCPCNDEEEEEEEEMRYISIFLCIKHTMVSLVSREREKERDTKSDEIGHSGGELYILVHIQMHKLPDAAA